MSARPVPFDPYSPLSTTQRDKIQHPSPFVPIRLPIFALVIWLNDFIVKVLSVGGGSPTKDNAGHAYAMGEATEIVEEGIELRRSPPVQPAKNRINIGRRKAD